MPLPKLIEGPEWTEDEIQAARRRGKKLALEHRDRGSPGVKLRFDADDAFDLIEAERLFDAGSQKLKVAMAHEMADAAGRFAKELAELA